MNVCLGDTSGISKERQEEKKVWWTVSLSKTEKSEKYTQSPDKNTKQGYISLSRKLFVKKEGSFIVSNHQGNFSRVIKEFCVWILKFLEDDDLSWWLFTSCVTSRRVQETVSCLTRNAPYSFSLQKWTRGKNSTEFCSSMRRLSVPDALLCFFSHRDLSFGWKFFQYLFPCVLMRRTSVHSIPKMIWEEFWGNIRGKKISISSHVVCRVRHHHIFLHGICHEMHNCSFCFKNSHSHSKSSQMKPQTGWWLCQQNGFSFKEEYSFQANESRAAYFEVINSDWDSKYTVNWTL